MASNDSAHFSTEVVAANRSLIAIPLEHNHQAPRSDDHILRYERDKRKSYIQMHTNFGPLTMELHSDLVPKTCKYFMQHCKNGCYDGTVFHRSIKYSMIQWGEPTKMECTKKSDLNDEIGDEISPQASHNRRGIVSMPKSVPNLTVPQLSITYGSCPHLDEMNIIFGRLVDGMDALDEMEKIEVDNNGQPSKPIRIQHVHILTDLCEEADAIRIEERVDEIDTQQMDVIDDKKRKQCTHSLETFHEAAANAKQFKFDIIVSIINGLFPKIENLEYFPTELLLQIFVTVDDIGLLSLFNSSHRFVGIAQLSFKKKYAEKYFVIDGETESQREFYSDMFSHFGNGIKAIEANGIRNIDGKNNWMAQMIHQYTDRIEKFTFVDCSFQQISDILSQHITDLTLKNCDNTEGSVLHSYCNLKKLRLEFDEPNDYVSPEMLAQTFRNNPALESLTLNLPELTFDIDYFIHEYIVIVAENLKHLKDIAITGWESVDWQFSNETMDLIVDSLKHLESMNIFMTPEGDELMRRLGLKCKSMKRLELRYWGYLTDDCIKAIGLFEAIEIIKLPYGEKSDAIENIVEHLPKLRRLILPMYRPPLNVFIFSLFLKCQTLEKITIDLGSNHSMGPINVKFFNEFTEIVQSPSGKIEFIHKKEIVGFITKKEIVWRNKLLHWIGWDPDKSSSSLNLLDLPSKSSEEKQSPFDIMLGYLDLGSLYLLLRANKRSNQLVHNFVARHSKEQVFTITDEFCSDGIGLNAFAKHIVNLRLHVFHTDFIKHLHAMKNHYENLNKLWIGSFPFHSTCHLSKLLTDYGTIFPQVRHLAIVDAGSEYYCDFCEIFLLYPDLETFETKTSLLFHGCDDCCEKNFRNLKKFTFKRSDEVFMNRIRKIFKNSDTKLISII